MVAVLRPCRCARLFSGGGPGCLLGLAACGPTGVAGTGWPGCGAGLLGVPVGGGPPASRPRCELRSVRRLEARPGPAAAHGHRSQALPRPPVPSTPVGPAVLGFWDAPVRVVTNVVNRRCFSCGFLPRCYKRRQSEGFLAENSGFWLGLTTFVTEALVGRFESRWFDDVCNVGRPPVARPGPAGAHAHRSLAPAPTMGVVSGSRSLAQ